jgi:hypothetical protein
MMSAKYGKQSKMHAPVTLAGLAALVFKATLAQAASNDVDAVLRSLLGKDEAAIEQRFGVPDQTESNGVQTFLRYHNFDSWRTNGAPYPFGYSQGFSGAHGFRDTANFDCTTTLVFVDGNLRAYARQGTGCQR